MSNAFNITMSILAGITGLAMGYLLGRKKRERMTRENRKAADWMLRRGAEERDRILRELEKE